MINFVKLDDKGDEEERYRPVVGLGGMECNGVTEVG